MPIHKDEKISLRQMYTNPTGSGSGNVASRYSIRSSMSMTFSSNYRQHKRQFIAVPYIAGNNTIYFWVKVPSRSYHINNIIYDVVIQIDPGDLALQLRPCKFFVNSPSFIFTYAYVFNRENLLIPWLKTRLPKQCLTDAPKVRNPVESRGYELILYQALAYLIVGGCATEEYINKYKKEFNAQTMIEIQHKVADVEHLIKVYNAAKFNEAKKHKKPVSAQDKKAKIKLVDDQLNKNSVSMPTLPKSIFGVKKPKPINSIKKPKIR